MLFKSAVCVDAVPPQILISSSLTFVRSEKICVSPIIIATMAGTWAVNCRGGYIRNIPAGPACKLLQNNPPVGPSESTGGRKFCFQKNIYLYNHYDSILTKANWPVSLIRTYKISRTYKHGSHHTLNPWKLLEFDNTLWIHRQVLEFNWKPYNLRKFQEIGKKKRTTNRV